MNALVRPRSYEAGFITPHPSISFGNDTDAFAISKLNASGNIKLARTTMRGKDGFTGKLGF